MRLARTAAVAAAALTVLTMSVRLLVMETVQQRRQRENRQINERLRTLIAAYKTLGGSFTGDLTVDPSHLRDLRLRSSAAAEDGVLDVGEDVGEGASSDRTRRIRDAVEAALSDVILLGTEEQVRLAAQAATELAGGRPVHTADLVVSLRDFIREVLDLDPVPAALSIPKQGPTRPVAGGKGKGGGGERDGSDQGGRGGGGGGGGGMGVGPGEAGEEAALPGRTQN